MTTRAKVTLPYTTALPTDVVVNTFHFGGPDDSGTDIFDKLVAFYTATPAGSTQPIGHYLSPIISRAGAACLIELYDMSDPEPRLPYQAGGFTMTAAGSGTGLPSEVNLCVSWKADAVSGIAPGRLRGRNYIGPWSDLALDPVEPARPNSVIVDVLVGAATALLNEVDAHPLVVFSQATIPAVEHVVTNGYVDNAWDTMRSRGEEATSRTTFS